MPGGGAASLAASFVRQLGSNSLLALSLPLRPPRSPIISDILLRTGLDGCEWIIQQLDPKLPESHVSELAHLLMTFKAVSGRSRLTI